MKTTIRASYTSYQSGSVKVYRKINNREIELAAPYKGRGARGNGALSTVNRAAPRRLPVRLHRHPIDADTFHEKISGVPQWFMSVIRTTSEKNTQG